MSTNRVPVALRKETVEHPLLGTVILRGMRLSERLAVGDVDEVEGEPAEARRKRSGRLFTARLMACAVLDADGIPLYGADEWDILLGGEHGAALEPLVDRAMRLSAIAPGGEGAEDVAKNG